MCMTNIASPHADDQRPDIWTPAFIAQLQALHDRRFDGIDPPDEDAQPMRSEQRRAIAGALADLVLADLARGAS